MCLTLICAPATQHEGQQSPVPFSPLSLHFGGTAWAGYALKQLSLPNTFSCLGSVLDQSLGQAGL